MFEDPFVLAWCASVLPLALVFARAEDRLDTALERLGWLGPLLVAAALAFAAARFGMNQFGGYDCSMMIEAAWRPYQGLRAHHDYPCTLPPGFWMAALAAYRVFGVSWWALVASNAVLAGGTVLALVALGRRAGLSRAMALLAAAAVPTIGMVQTAHLWHSSLAVTAGAVAAGAAVALVERPGSRRRAAVYAAALAVLVMQKPNVAGPLAVLLSAVLLVHAPTRAPALAATLAAAALDAALLLAQGVSPADVLRGYASIAPYRAFENFLIVKQMLPLDRFYTYTFFFTSMAAAAIALIAIVQAKAPQGPRVWLGLSALAVGLYGIITNYDIKLNDYGLIAFAVALLFAWGRPAGRAGRCFLAAYLGTLVLSGLHFGNVRFRNILVGHRVFHEPGEGVEVSEPPFFRGLTCGRRLALTLAEMRRALAEHPGRPAFFGPRVDFGYAAFGLPSPPGLPVWWHPGSSHSPEITSEIVAAWHARAFGVLIFLKDDAYRIPPGIVDSIKTERDYRPVGTYENLTVYVRKAP